MNYLLILKTVPGCILPAGGPPTESSNLGLVHTTRKLRRIVKPQALIGIIIGLFISSCIAYILYLQGSDSERVHEFHNQNLCKKLGPKKLLFVGVVTTRENLGTRALGIQRTWGMEVSDLKFFSPQLDDNNLQLPIVSLPEIKNSQHSTQRVVYRALKYMLDHFIDDFHFFMLLGDDTYVKVDMVMELLRKINPENNVHVGFGNPNNQQQINQKEDERYCAGGPGIFSHSALQNLASLLDECLKVVCVIAIASGLVGWVLAGPFFMD